MFNLLKCLSTLLTAPLLAHVFTTGGIPTPSDFRTDAYTAPSTDRSTDTDPSTDTDRSTDTVTDTAGASVWLVTLDGNDAGWAVIENTSQWLSPECRGDIEADGGWFEPVEWAVLESTVDPAQELSCDQVADLAFGETTDPVTPPTPPAAWGEAQLLRGINFAGDFEVEPRGAWGQPIQDDDFARAAAAGFDHVRVPIRWSSYTGAAPGYTIDQGFFAEVDHLVDLAQAAGLTIVIDVHHFEELDQDPAGERNRYLAIWEQLAEHYQYDPASVVFELLNEPIGVFNDQPELWNQLAAESLEIVRRSNPTRTVIIGPVSYNHANRLDDLVLPADDNLVATIHTYDPDSFTVQGAVFIDPVPATGVTWRANNASVAFDWRQQSWDVQLAPTPEGIAIEWDRSFAAFAVGALEETAAWDTVQITASEAFDAVVLCNYDGANGLDLDVTWSGTTGTADVSACGPVNSLALQHVGTDLRPIALSRFAGCAESCEELVVTQWESLDALISGAADWSAAQGVPLYIGEFGTYNSLDTPIDVDSRRAWTNAVRTIAEQNAAGWAYFAMSDEFGAYDREAGRWLLEIVDALFD